MKQLFLYFPQLWLSPSSLPLLLQADCHNVPLRQLEFFHKMQPQQLQLPSETTKNASNEIFSSPQPISVFSPSFSEVGRVNSDSQTYGFIRLFVLSFGDSNNLIEGCSHFIENLMFDKSEWIAAAAIQCIILWMINNKYKCRHDALYKAAAGVLTDKLSPAIRIFYRILLKTLGTDYSVTGSIINDEPELDYQPSMGKEIRQAPWIFPHFLGALDNVEKIEPIRFSDSLRMIGIISDILGLNEINTDINNDINIDNNYNININN